MVLEAINELATGFEGCEKKLEIDFKLLNTNDVRGLRNIPRESIDRILTFARCTVISVTSNDYFDAYVLSESSLFVYPTKVIIKTCGTTLLLRCLNELLLSAKVAGAEPDFLQFSRSNFIFPHRQAFPHRAFGEESDYLNKALSKQGHAFILGPIHGPRWHLYTLDFKVIDASAYQQQTLEIIMFNLDPSVMKTFYKRKEGEEHVIKIGFPTGDGKEATIAAGIDKFLPGATIDDNLFTPCGYSCNGLLNEAYFTIHITPEPECSFVSFETNLVSKNYTELVQQVIDTFRPGTWSVSLFVDECSQCPDSRSGLSWNYPGFDCKGVMHHAFPDKYNATCAQFQRIQLPTSPQQDAYGSAALKAHVSSPHFTSYTAKLNAANGTNVHDFESPSDTPFLSLGTYSYETVASLSLEQMLELAVDTARGRFVIDGALSPSKPDSSSSSSNAPSMAVESENVNSDRVRQLASRVISVHLPEKAFYLIDIGQLVRRFHAWANACPRLIPFYAVGSDCDTAMVCVLSALGCHYNAHSIPAAKQLLRVGVNPARVLLTMPFKTTSIVRFARDHNIPHLTVHTQHELDLIAIHFPKAKLVLQLATTENTPGNSLEQTIALATYANSKQLEVLGIRLTLPPSISDKSLVSTMSLLKEAYFALSAHGAEIRVVDLGSVFPLDESGELASSAAKLVEKIDAELPSTVQLWANPALTFEDNTRGLVVNVLSKTKKNKSGTQEEQKSTQGTKRPLVDDEAHCTHHASANGKPVADVRVDGDSLNEDAAADFSYVVGEGSGVVVSSQANKRRRVLTVSSSHENDKSRFESSLLGVSGDAICPVVESASLPELQIGDWLYLSNVRPPALSQAAAAPSFADADPYPVYYVSS